MYRILILLPVIFAFIFFVPQSSNYEESTDGITICHTFLPDDMRQFALDPEFQALHASPLPLDYDGIGKKITFKTSDGTDAKGYFIKAKKKSNKWLFVYQEWWGLNEYIERQSDTFYKDLGENVNVLAVDMYDGKSSSNPQEAGKLMSETKDARLVNIVNGAFAFAGPKAKVANVGWCFGGSWSLRSAILGGKNTIGSVMYYGMPVSDIDELKKLNSDVLGLFATETRISKEVIEQFDANMNTAGKKLTYKIFSGVHGFANPSNPKFDEENAKVAYGMALDYLKSKY
ncbi:dienelactone hydrolase [Lacihabitans sp. LS3-19]|uniref:dienelactone hydrolase family protein n=1 Tax=Lacihabitans sp. LS3-19 TaxID=2487335 RepID=UPI0020CD66EA|nr:dienelactone hydrolase family protein [Lacihabitans sp. LS3-19]MCP9769639.1 dienelactone hydrolase [Lacihabitans sp. LS3-19]